jgi:glycosyltransferase involved in cell wall biosynthesis
VRVAIVTSGRFHVLDLARTLAAIGHQVSFYSHVPRSRARQFGLPDECHRALLPYVAPLVALQRAVPVALTSEVDHMLQVAIDGVAAYVLEPCDVFIGMSGICVRAAKRAREKYGARIFLERGSRHVLSQKEILEAVPGVALPAVPPWSVERELWGYDYADVVTVPSYHTERSFLDRGIPLAKLFRNPYGVDLEMFPATPKPANKLPTVIFAGAWSLRKGCDLLWDACRSSNHWRLLHVGAITDAPVPSSPLFEHRGPVSQHQLADMYRKADIFVHASREEGLSLVQAQALACGLPLVCTDRTGGEDLRDMLSDPSWVTVVAHGSSTALKKGIEQGLALAAQQTGLREILGEAREKLSWRAYGERYHRKLVASEGRVRTNTIDALTTVSAFE